MNTRTRSSLLGVAALAIAGVTLAGCSASPTDAAASGSLIELADDQQVEIVFESYNLAQAGIWSDTINGLLDGFMEAHPNITVVGQPSVVTGGGTAGSVQQQLLAGDPPDVAQLTFNELDFAATTLGAQNLTELVGQARLDEQFGGEYPYHERATVLADWNGATYGMPYVFSTPVLWINEDMFEAAGLDPATVDLSTWDAVSDAAETITASTGSPSVGVSCTVIGGNWCMQGIFLSNGAQVLSDDRSTIEFGSDAAVDTLQVFRDMYDAGILMNSDAATQVEDFMSNKTALMVNTSVYQSTLMATAEAGGWTLNAATLPAFGDKPVVPTNSGSMLAMFATDPAKQAASWELIKWMTSPEAYEAISTGIGYLPLRSSMTEGDGPLAEWVAANPLVQPNLRQLDDLQPWVSYPGDSYAQVDQLLGTAIEESVYYGADITTTLKDAAARAQDLIE